MRCDDFNSDIACVCVCVCNGGLCVHKTITLKSVFAYLSTRHGKIVVSSFYLWNWPPAHQEELSPFDGQIWVSGYLIRLVGLITVAGH